jgi:hypothetical protein
MFELDIPSISAIVAATGVLVGVVLTVIELRNLVKQRQTDLVIRLSSDIRSREFLGAFVDTYEAEFKDYDDSWLATSSNNSEFFSEIDS